jgi:S-adenosylmethionine:tRNA-ribosyltransferase-isomerase (queuine synthetase)
VSSDQFVCVGFGWDRVAYDPVHKRVIIHLIVIDKFYLLKEVSDIIEILRTSFIMIFNKKNIIKIEVKNIKKSG